MALMPADRHQVRRAGRRDRRARHAAAGAEPGLHAQRRARAAASARAAATDAGAGSDHHVQRPASGAAARAAHQAGGNPCRRR